jgi:hypothetical protein
MVEKMGKMNLDGLDNMETVRKKFKDFSLKEILSRL